VKGPMCVNCKSNNKCEGIFKEYAERKGFNELKPVKDVLLKNKANT